MRLAALEGNGESNDTVTAHKEDYLQRDAQLIYLAELIYALYAFAPFSSNRNINPTTIARYFSGIFHIKIDRVRKKIEEIRLRKKNRTVFLDLLKAALNRQIKEDDLHAPG